MTGSEGSEPKLTGLSKYFNSVTDNGRANVAKATYAAIAAIGLYYYLKPKKKAEKLPESK
ncbi:ATP synthase F(0) complex subunit k, mitochondrial [Nomia melanderi]|uniref:ATP synthase F(0) complex subunit k, mitochondrial n=1 Tax=Nomia melanderi TaxID=2448451 RepID=UPI003FCD89B7